MLLPDKDEPVTVEHVLVEFEDKSLSVIPTAKFIDIEKPNVGESHSIQWLRKVYKATVLSVAMY